VTGAAFAARAEAQGCEPARVTGAEQPAPRIPYSPEEIRDRFRSCFGRQALR
jgi:hypothetical protein